MAHRPHGVNAKGETFPWRNSRQLAGVRSRLQAAINEHDATAYSEGVTLDFKTARNLLEVCDQAIYTEKGHEPC